MFKSSWNPYCNLLLLEIPIIIIIHIIPLFHSNTLILILTAVALRCCSKVVPILDPSSEKNLLDVINCSYSDAVLDPTTDFPLVDPTTVFKSHDGSGWCW